MIRHPPSSPPFPNTTLSRSKTLDLLTDVTLRQDLPVGIPDPRFIIDHQHPNGRLALFRHGGPHAAPARDGVSRARSEEHTSELQSQSHLVCRLLLEKKKPYLPRISSQSSYHPYARPLISYRSTTQCAHYQQLQYR